ncbi:MAG: secretin and TonB N-terminal domain-containing protein [Bacillota bacterium]|nr:secretin and TonB N-terminal domain-containing protein [Bacillota bacterium]
MKRLPGLLQVGVTLGLCVALVGNLTICSLPGAAAGGTVTLDFKDTDIRDILRVLGAQQGVSILPDPGIAGPVTIHLTDVPFEEGLRALLESQGLTYTKQGNVYRVQRAKTAQFKVAWNKEKGRLSLSASGADLGELAREITNQTGINVVLERGARATVTATLVDLPFEAALGALAEANGLRAVKRENYWALAPADGATGGGLEQLQVEGDLLTLRAREVDLGLLLRELSARANLNLVADREARGPVSGSLVRVPLVAGLTTLLEANGFQLVNRGDTYVVRRAQASNFTLVRRPDGKFDLNVSGADLGQVLRELAERAGVNLVVYNYVRAQVAQVTVEGVTLEEAFTYLLKGTPLVFRKEGNLYLVGDAGTLRPDSLDLIQSRFFRLAYVAPEGLAALLPPIFPANAVRPVKELSGIVATGSPELLGRLEEYLKMIDVPGRGGTVELVRLTNTKADELAPVLGRVYSPQGLQPLRDGSGFLLSGTPEMVAQMKETIGRLDQPSPATSRLFVLKHLRAEDVTRLLPPGMDKAGVLALPHLNAVVASGNEAYLAQLAAYLHEIDAPTPQILFDVLVVEYSRDVSDTAGLSMTGKEGQVELKLNEGDSNDNPTGLVLNVNSGWSLNPSFSATLKALVHQGKAKILANPKLAALSGETASFNVITKSYYWDPRYEDSDANTAPNTGTGSSGTSGTGGSSGTTTTTDGTLPTLRGGAPRSIDTGLKVKVKPWVSGTGEITIDIEPSISDSMPSQADLPKTNERSARTTVRVKDGETIIIGGLIQSEVHRQSYRVPLLGSIPVIGALFRSKNNLDRQSEFVIYITPHLVTGAEEANRRFVPLWQPEELKKEGAAAH